MIMLVAVSTPYTTAPPAIPTPPDTTNAPVAELNVETVDAIATTPVLEILMPVAVEDHGTMFNPPEVP